MRTFLLPALAAWLCLTVAVAARALPVTTAGPPGWGAGTAAVAVQGRSWRNNQDQERARDAYRSGDVLPLSRVLAIVRGQVPGRLLDADLRRRGGAYVYVIKLLDSDDRVRIVQVDARTGGILSVR